MEPANFGIIITHGHFCFWVLNRSQVPPGETKTHTHIFIHYKVGIKSFNRFNRRRLAHGPYIFGEGTIDKTTSNKTKRLNFLLHTTQMTGILWCVCAKRLRGETARKENKIKVVPTKRSILTVNKILPSKMGQFIESTIMTKSHHLLKCPPHHSNVLRCILTSKIGCHVVCRLISLGHPSKQASKQGSPQPHNHAWQDY
jgi:hypothetical protein